MILCSIQNKHSSPFLSLECVLSMFLNVGHFSASRSYKKVLFIKKECILFHRHFHIGRISVAKVPLWTLVQDDAEETDFRSYFPVLLFAITRP